MNLNKRGVASMEPFLKKFFPGVYKKMMMKRGTRSSNYYAFNNQLLTSFTSSLYVAGLVASIMASSVTRVFGQKSSMVIGGAAFLVDSALSGAAQNVFMLILGHLLLGVDVGFANQAVPLYLLEMAPTRYRGAFNTGFQLSIGIGALTANLINYGTQKIKQGFGWRIKLAMATVPASILILGSLFLPETPNSMIQRTGDVCHAELVLRRVWGTPDVGDELSDLVRAGSEIKTDYADNPFV
ncbi:PREDICTED: hexose carrier protein HEX6-like [Tarenaya hassleriana]|uniref:hexose carrier protein HEX6-like n=1 Tax=Tarenaya hassleriana TaxID=28532 RepID=UPI0008FD7736|nr:PREDICTED: hexose carrier protein HEX6-like [Tarenaya hassleriana]